MVKIIYADRAAVEKKAGKVPAKRIRQPNGRLRTVYDLDANDPDFEDQLLQVFRRNVARVRRMKRSVAAE